MYYYSVVAVLKTAKPQAFVWEVKSASTSYLSRHNRTFN